MSSSSVNCETMKALVVLSFVLVVVAAEPPYFRVRSLQDQSDKGPFDVEPQLSKTVDSPRNAPYPPSGWRPMGQRFELPSQQQESMPVPDQKYGPPLNVYGPPQNVYGPPQNDYEASKIVNGPPKNAPYPPSGWRPVGQRFELPPQEKEQTPAPTEDTPKEDVESKTIYGPPQNVYGPPQTVYGPPEDVNEASTTPETMTTTDNDIEQTTDSTDGKESKVKSENEVKQPGPYYIIVPDSKFQNYYYSYQSVPGLQQYSSTYQTYPTQQYSSPLYVYTPQFYYQWY